LERFSKRDKRRAAAMLFLVMAPFGPLYFLEKHPRRSLGGPDANDATDPVATTGDVTL